MFIRDAIVLAMVFASAPVCFLRPVYGVLVWAVMSFVNPQDFGWGVAQHASPALVIAIPTLAGFCVFSRSWNRLICRETVLLLLLWLWFTVTTLNGAHDPAFADKSESAWYHWNMLSKIFLMTAVTIAVINTERRLRYLALTIAGCFGFLALKNLPVVILTDGASRVYGPPNSMIADNNDFGLALNMALPFFFFLAKAETNRKVKWLMGLLFLVTIPAIIFTYSRGALIGLIVVLMCMILQSKQRLILSGVALLVLAFALIFAPQKWRDRMSADNALDASAKSRLNVWQYSWILAKDYPLMGGGFDAFTPSLFARYAPKAIDVHGPHSIYFGVLAEHGFIGLTLYLSMIGLSLGSLHNIARRCRRFGGPGVHYANMFRASIAGFMVSGTFLGRAYFDLFFTVIACVAILKQVENSTWIPVAAEEPRPTLLEGWSTAPDRHEIGITYSSDPRSRAGRWRPARSGVSSTAGGN